MIPETFASRQALRFSTLRNPPNSAEGVEELVAALRKHALNEDHAVRIADRWIKESRFWPTPVDIAELAEQLPASAVVTKPNKSCPKCFGCGYEEVYTLTTHERIGESHYKRVEKFEGREKYEELRKLVDGINQKVYTHARRCTHCDYGRTLQRQEEERNPDAPMFSDIPELDESRLQFEPRPERPAAKKPLIMKRNPYPDLKQPPAAGLRPITQRDVDKVSAAIRSAKDEDYPD